MRHPVLIGSLFLSIIFAPFAVAQESPRVLRPLGDIMGLTQLRHIKLWFAGKLENWELAGYELAQMEASLKDAADLYRGIPVEDVTLVIEPMKAISNAIEAKDSTLFAKAYDDLTNACNACHRAIDRGYIIIHTPNSSPFSDQSFSPHH